MINDEKIAAKVYAMETLFLFGKDVEWIYPEIKEFFETNYPRARAKRILKKIKKSDV